MSKIIVLRGLPASGKSTFALAEAARTGAVRVNRDELRAMLFGKRVGLTFDQERLVSDMERAAVQAAVEAGQDVIIDAMHLRARYVQDWRRFGRAKNIEVVLHELPVLPLEEAIARDRAREHSVGEDFLRLMYSKFVRKGELVPVPDLPAAIEDDGGEYVPPVGKPSVFLCDLDGTVALNNGHRGWYEYEKVGDDAVVENIREVVLALSEAGYGFVYMSGRPDSCRSESEAWLARHGFPEGPLFMRDSGDNRSDEIVKRELFDAHVRSEYRVVACLDDRNRVVKMWRGLGLSVLQVADGDF